MSSISDKFRHCGFSIVSFSTFATVNLTDFRNGTVISNAAEEDDTEVEMGVVAGDAPAVESESTELEGEVKPKTIECWKKITAEIGYALLLVVSLVELVVRALLTAIAIPLLFVMECLCFTGKAMAHVANIAGGGVLLTAENIAKLTVLLFTNMCEEEINYDQHFPDFKPCNDCFGNYVNDFFGGKLHRPQKLEEQQEVVVEEKF